MPLTSKSSDKTPPLRVGMVNFINTAPFYEPWKEVGTPMGWEVVEGVPSHLNTQLLQGKIQAGLVSSFTYGANPDELSILKDISISARGPVKSVLLLSPWDLSDVRATSRGPQTILVTPKSATSVMLLRIILEVFFKKVYGVDFILEKGNIAHAIEKNCPYLAIGDEALCLAQSPPFHHVFDLAEFWIKETGLPFVFAVMAVKEEYAQKDRERLLRLYHHIRRCTLLGMERLEEISQRVAPRVPMEPNACLSYLRGIEYDLSPEKQRGLRMYFKYLKEIGVIKKAPVLRFFPAP